MFEFDDDDDFLSQVAAVEAAALSSSASASKHRRISATVTPTSNSTSPAISSKISSTTLQNSTTTTSIGEGAYIATLKGSKSIEFQKQTAIFSSSSVSRQNYIPYSTSNNNSSPFPASVSGNTCFKCGKSCRWARDCDAASVNDEYGSSSFPKKNCPSGLGNCVVLTANTERNRGRKFYKCPIRQFVWNCWGD